MAEFYQKFLEYDWSDERWQAYLQGLYPPPKGQQMLKYQKKWYKKTVDPDFDDKFEPLSSSSPSSSSTAGAGSGGGQPSVVPPFMKDALQNDGSRWSKMGPKATICFYAYAVAMTMTTGSVAGALPAYQSLFVLVGAFVLEILAKYGIKFNAQYMQSVVLDDVGPMPIMSLTLLTPGLHPVMRTLALVPPFLTALLTFSQICKAHAQVPELVRTFFSPLAEMHARCKVMQVRADLEVILGFIIIGGVFAGRAAPISPLLFWNFMMMRYIMNPWTRASFTKIDNTLDPVLGHIPGISRLYGALKRNLYSFVDPESRRSGQICNIL